MLAAVVSDTHGQVEDVIQVLRHYPQLKALFFLGDFYHDAEEIVRGLELAEEIPVFAVCGNGDAFFYGIGSEDDEVVFGGKTFFLTHGHRYQVKKTLDQIVERGNALQADVAMFGHTHIPFLGKSDRGMWVLNPGSAAFPRGADDTSFALLEWEDGGELSIMIMEVATGQLLFSSMDFQ